MPVLLIVEDDDLTRDMLCDMLRGHADWLVMAVDDGRTLLKTIETIKPDLILLDVTMYDISGLEAYHLLREHATATNVPVLFVTADPEPIRRAGLTGVYRAIQKPFHLDELLHQVHAMLATP
jgi:DNA-binding response OmpR family regulator